MNEVNSNYTTNLLRRMDGRAYIDAGRASVGFTRSGIRFNSCDQHNSEADKKKFVSQFCPCLPSILSYHNITISGHSEAFAYRSILTEENQTIKQQQSIT